MPSPASLVAKQSLVGPLSLAWPDQYEGQYLTESGHCQVRSGHRPGIPPASGGQEPGPGRAGVYVRHARRASATARHPTQPHP